MVKMSHILGLISDNKNYIINEFAQLSGDKSLEHHSEKLHFWITGRKNNFHY